MTTIDSEKDEKIEQGKRLKHIRRTMAKMTRDELEKYGLSMETLKNWELGRTGLTEKGARRIVTIFREIGIQFSMGWLLRAQGNPPVFLKEFIGNRRDGTLLETEEEVAEEDTVPEEITAFCKHADAIYMKIGDDGMEPRYRQGEYVAGKRYYRESIDEAIGEDCIVETQKGEILLRRVREGIKEGYYFLLCLNADTVSPVQFLYETELTSAAPVRFHLRLI